MWETCFVQEFSFALDCMFNFSGDSGFVAMDNYVGSHNSNSDVMGEIIVCLANIKLN